MYFSISGEGGWDWYRWYVCFLSLALETLWVSSTLDHSSLKMFVFRNYLLQNKWRQETLETSYVI